MFGEFSLTNKEYYRRNTLNLQKNFRSYGVTQKSEV